MEKQINYKNIKFINKFYEDLHSAVKQRNWAAYKYIQLEIRRHKTIKRRLLYYISFERKQNEFS